MARRTRFRRLDGLLLLDKPQGLSSNQALQRVRHLLRAEKGGHTGALDPLATGMLPLCFGEATKIAGLLLSENKAYRARIQLGAETDTDDSEGQVIRQRAVPNLDVAALQTALQSFVGTIQQVPPRYSALKREGEPLYKRARRGEAFDIPARAVTIHRIDTLAMGSDWLELEVACGSGTYIRSLARDLGETLGCGGHISALRRLWVSPFESLPMLDFDHIEAVLANDEAALAEALLPIAIGLRHWHQIRVDAAQEQRLRQGQPLATEAALGNALVVDESGNAVGVVDVSDDGLMRPRRLFLPAVV